MATLDIIARFRNQASSEAKQLKRDIDGIDKEAKKATKSTKQLESGWKSFGALLAAGGVLAAGRQLISWQQENIRLAGIQEGAERQLEQTIRSTGGAAGFTATELKQMASGLQEVTRFGDEATIEGQSLLLTFTNIGRDVFPRATETMLDMSQALGQDMKSSAIQLGKALNDPITGVTALQRVGVSFTDSQKEQIKTLTESGQVMEAQNLILDELSRQFGGQARAAAETYTGEIEQLSNTYGDLREQLGLYLRMSAEQIGVTKQVVGNLTTHLTLVNKLDEEVAKGNISFEESQRILREVSFTSKTAGEAIAELTEAEIEQEQALMRVNEELEAADAILLRNIDSKTAAAQAAIEYSASLAAASGGNAELGDKIAQTNNLLTEEEAALAHSRGELNLLTADYGSSAAAAAPVVSLTERINQQLERLGNRHDFLLNMDVQGLEGFREAVNLASGFNANDQPDPLSSQGDRDFGDEFDQSGFADNVPGFQLGGYTGPGPRNKFAGLVHFDELVVPGDDLRRGPAAILDFAQANVPGGIGLGGRTSGTITGGSMRAIGDTYHIYVTVPGGSPATIGQVETAVNRMFTRKGIRAQIIRKAG